MDNTRDFPLLAVHAIYEDSLGGLWVAGSKLVRLAGGQVTEFRLEGKASENRVKSLVETADSTIWAGTVSGLNRLVRRRGTSNQFERVREVRGTVRFLRQTSDGALWIGTIGHGLFVSRASRFSQMIAPARLPSNTVLNLFEDVEKNIWIGTQAGMLRLSNTPVRTVVLPDASDSDAETVYEDRDGELWIAAANLFRFRNGQATPFNFPGLDGVRIRNVFRDREGALWIGTEGRGVYRQVGQQLFHYTTESGLVNNFVRAFLQSRDGSIWIGTDEGVSRSNSQGFRSYQMRDGLCYFSTLDRERTFRHVRGCANRYRRRSRCAVRSAQTRYHIDGSAPAENERCGCDPCHSLTISGGRFVVLTTYEGDEDIHRALEAGAKGYIIKGMPYQTLIEALLRVHAGGRFLPPPVARALASRMPDSDLSSREQEVLRHLVAGMSNKEIAGLLGITEATVKCHVSTILMRLNVSDRTQAVVSALQRGLVHL